MKARDGSARQQRLSTEDCCSHWAAAPKLRPAILSYFTLDTRKAVMPPDHCDATGKQAVEAHLGEEGGSWAEQALGRKEAGGLGQQQLRRAAGGEAHQLSLAAVFLRRHMQQIRGEVLKSDK